jgi:predicted GNAT superfamily acetyltransferase
LIKITNDVEYTIDDIIIRSVETMEEIHGIVEVQRDAWQMDDLGIVPTFETKAVSKIGVVLIAIDPDNTVVGFIYAYPQFPNAHYSHMMATLRKWQGKGVGYRMKIVHRNIALKSPYNINLIDWTVDPLLANNAYLNFTKLGVECSTYYPDFYGDATTEGAGIYQDMPTDRFLVNWKIRDERVNRRMNNHLIDRIDKSELFSRSPPINKIENSSWVDVEVEYTNSFSVQVPSEFQKLKQQSLEIAMDWRVKFRELCLKFFEQGWKAYDYHSFVINGIRENYYEFILGDKKNEA